MKPPAMKTPALATVYLDNEPVGLMGDPRPLVSKIVAAAGKRPESVRVLRAQSATDQRGKPVTLADVIDRTAEPTRPIYLTSKPTGRPPPPAAAPASGAMQATPAMAIEAPSTGRAGPRPFGDPSPKEPEAEWDP